MSDAEIRRRLDSLIDLFQARIDALTAERDLLRARVHEYEAISCGHPGCLVMQTQQLD